MPTYYYKCDKHGEFEVFHSIKDKLTTCPKCKDEGVDDQPVHRLLAGGSGFILQGGGWFKDGY